MGQDAIFTREVKGILAVVAAMFFLLLLSFGMCADRGASGASPMHRARATPAQSQPAVAPEPLTAEQAIARAHDLVGLATASQKRQNAAGADAAYAEAITTLAGTWSSSEADALRASITKRRAALAPALRREQARSARAAAAEQARQAKIAEAEAVRQEYVTTCGPMPEIANLLAGIEVDLRQTAHDPDSIDVARCSVPELTARDCWITECAVRGRNGFGALILNAMRIHFRTRDGYAEIIDSRTL